MIDPQVVAAVSEDCATAVLVEAGTVMTPVFGFVPFEWHFPALTTNSKKLAKHISICCQTTEY